MTTYKIPTAEAVETGYNTGLTDEHQLYWIARGTDGEEYGDALTIEYDDEYIDEAHKLVMFSLVQTINSLAKRDAYLYDISYGRKEDS